MLSELRQWWEIGKKVILGFGILLTFFAFVEILRVFVVLRDVYPPLGYAFVVVFLIVCAWFSVHVALSIKKRPKVLVPPDIEDLSLASRKELRSYSMYLVKYLKRLSQNPNLSEEDARSAGSRIVELEKNEGSETIEAILLAAITETEVKTIQPLLMKLDKMADTELRRSVRDIMLGVALSPYRAGDLMVVIYRNARMVLRLVEIYHSRPLLSEQVSILMDVLKVVTAVNYLNLGQKLMQEMAANIPFAGRALGDLTQAFGAGFLTSVAGHAAIDRCRPHRQWNEQVAVRTMRSGIGAFYNDVKGIFTEDILPSSAGALLPVAATQEMVEKMKKGISQSIDLAAATIDSAIISPAIAGKKQTEMIGRTVVKTGMDTLSQGAGMIHWTSKKLGKGVEGALRIAGSGISQAYGSVGKRVRSLGDKKQSDTKTK